MAEPNFSFITDSYPGEFTLIGFNGTEGMSQMFQFTLKLKVEKKVAQGINFQAVLAEGCSLVVDDADSSNGKYVIGGMLQSIDEEFHGSNTHKYYTAVMVPGLWRQSKNKSYDIYVKQAAPQILEAELRDDVMIKHSMKTTQTYPEKNFVCQYAESNFNFVSRLASHWGIYFYFDHQQNGELIFSDNTSYDQAVIASAKLDISNNPSFSFDTVRTLRRSYNAVPDGVVISEINPDQATEHFEGSAGEIDGKNSVHLVNEGCDSKDEAELLAEIRLQEYQCYAVEFEGTTGIPYLAPGFVLNVEDDAGNSVAEILITQVRHNGNHLDNGHRASEEGHSAPFYEASFVGIPKDIQYRPDSSRIQKPRAISATARVHADGDQQDIAQRDSIGKYQVVFDFLKDEKKVSSWIRLARQTARTNHFDMPLTPGTEVQVAFIDGNPDRPYIQSALENSQSLRHPVNNENPHHASIRTDGLLYTEALKSHQTLHISGLYDSSEVLNNIQQSPLKVLGPDGTDSGETLDYIAGNHHIDERYGDRYERTYGADYIYGVNARFRFGSLYEENHTFDASVGSGNNQFDLSDRLYSNDASMVTTDPFDVPLNSERKGGIVRKDFGNTYGYHAGVASTWAQGEGLTGIHQTYNYGGRFIENNVDLGAGKGVPKPGPSLPGSWDDNSLVTQNIGNTYEHIEGEHYVGHKGDFTFQRDGSATETLTGDITRTITGNVTEDITGDVSTTITGAAQEVTKTLSGDYTETVTTGGNYTENITVTGENNILKMSAVNKSTVLGQISDTIVDVTSTTNCGLVSENFLGVKTSSSLSATMEMKAGASVTVDNVSKLWEGKVSIANGKVKLEKSTTATANYNVYSLKSTLVIIG